MGEEAAEVEGGIVVEGEVVVLAVVALAVAVVGEPVVVNGAAAAGEFAAEGAFAAAAVAVVVAVAVEYMSMDMNTVSWPKDTLLACHNYRMGVEDRHYCTVSAGGFARVDTAAAVDNAGIGLDQVVGSSSPRDMDDTRINRV